MRDPKDHGNDGRPQNVEHDQRFALANFLLLRHLIFIHKSVSNSWVLHRTR